MKILFYFFFNTFILNFYWSKVNDNSRKEKENDNKLCDLSSDMIAIETINHEKSIDVDRYNIKQTISINHRDNLNIDDVNIKCNYFEKNKILTTTKQGHAELIEKFSFSNRNYFFFNFLNLKKGKSLKIKCSCSIKETNPLTILYAYDMPTTKNNEEVLIIKHIKFPHHNLVTKLLAFGDWSISNEGETSKNLIKSILPTIDSILYLGDLAYDLELEDGEIGNKFMEYIREITSTTPFQLSVGNHESFDHYIHYSSRFFLPNRSTNKTFYYSYDINNIHIISLNSEAAFNEDFDTEYIKKMIEWLDNDLKIQTTRNWKIVYMHRPMYCSKINSKDCTEDTDKLRELFEHIFLKYSVDLVLSGHRHNYERIYPVYNNTVDVDSLKKMNNTYVNPKYPSYVICGATGNSESMEDEIYQPREFSKIVGNTIGICKLEITETVLKFSHILSQNNKVYDTFHVIKFPITYTDTYKIEDF